MHRHCCSQNVQWPKSKQAFQKCKIVHDLILLNCKVWSSVQFWQYKISITEVLKIFFKKGLSRFGTLYHWCLQWWGGSAFLFERSLKFVIVNKCILGSLISGLIVFFYIQIFYCTTPNKKTASTLLDRSYKRCIEDIRAYFWFIRTSSVFAFLW